VSEPTTSSAWYHCTRCGSLFKGVADPEQRGVCPDCGGDPCGESEVLPAGSGPVRVRRKIRKKQPGKVSRRKDKGKARALMVVVILWVFLLAAGAILMTRGGSQDGPQVADPTEPTRQEIEDQRLLHDKLGDCGRRFSEFRAAQDVGSRALHVLGAGRAVQRMTRVQQFNPSYSTNEAVKIEEYRVIHTPAGRAIETLWKQEDGQRLEAVFFEEEDEWKIDWDAFARAGTESWPLFLAGRGHGEGEFRLLARERIGADGRDDEFLGLVLYAARNGRLEEASAPSPEIRVLRNSPVGSRIEEAFAIRKEGIGAFGSKLVAHDPDEMIRLRVRISREGEDERVFKIEELVACHWLEPVGAKEADK
jgi:hypothetical protein